MSKQRTIMVAKHEGGIERFDPRKLRRCLAAALRDSGREPRIADALARAVELHLQSWTDPAPPSSAYIFRCIRTALFETGLEDVALRLVGHRQERAAKRAKLSVFDAGESLFALTPWRKEALAGTFEGRHGVSHAAARILAGEVERRVLALEYHVISKALIRELVRNELLAWGLTDAVTDLAPAALGAEIDPQTA